MDVPIFAFPPVPQVFKMKKLTLIYLGTIIPCAAEITSISKCFTIMHISGKLAYETDIGDDMDLDETPNLVQILTSKKVLHFLI